MPFQPGHPRYGGKAAGSRNKATIVHEELRDQLIVEALQSLGLTPEAVEGISALTVMKLVMCSRLRAGDGAGALQAAIELAPYEAPRLTSSDLSIRSGQVDPDITDEELAREIRELEAQAAEVKKLR
jgi:hypothetical protein